MTAIFISACGGVRLDHKFHPAGDPMDVLAFAVRTRHRGVTSAHDNDLRFGCYPVPTARIRRFHRCRASYYPPNVVVYVEEP